MDEIVHLYWHRLRKGMCLTCGYYCIDCPKGVASCKCTPKPVHIYNEDCRNPWCRVHWCPVWRDGEMGPELYPIKFNILTSEQGWVNQEVFCGPAAYYPKKVKK